MQRTLNCAGRLIDVSSPKVMGILNLTPDSFYSKSRFSLDKELLGQAEKMIRDGVTFIDVGGYSSRPGASFVSEKEELSRVVPAVVLLLKNFPDILISVDTFRSEVAKKGIEAGAVIVNDISGGNLDEDMFKTIAQVQVPYVMMHLRGTPQTMMQFTHYDDMMIDITRYFSEKIAQAQAAGINDIILDPGFGFAKTRQQNFEVLNHLEHFAILEKPLLVGISRKSMIYKTLQVSAHEAKNGTSVLNTIALLKGASILRVHDVKEAIETIRLVEEVSYK